MAEAYLDSQPDPGRAADLAEFVDALGRLRMWAGGPSYREMADRVGPLLRPPQDVSKSTISDVFQPGRRRLNQDLVVAIVRALGLDEPAVARWRAACVRVHAEAKTGGPVGVFRQLPPDLATFTGRREELDRLMDTIAELGSGSPQTVVITAIDGMAGVGKTQLAVHAAHELARAGRYTDLQLFVNLRGFDPDGPPAEPSAVIDAFLRQLEVPAGHIPGPLDERAAMFRDRMQGRDALIVLDNAADEDQVRLLIPASPTCLVLITSRRMLTALDGAVPCSLDVFSTDEAVQLLGRIAGTERVAAEPEAAREVVGLCGLLPLAVSLAASRLRSRPRWSLADLAKRLRDEGVDAVTVGGKQLRSVFDLSYGDLPPPARRLFCLLGLVPGDSFDADVAAALADIPRSDAQRLLELLQDENLLQAESAERLQFHDLIRQYAVERVIRDETADDRQAALHRYLAWHLNTADAAARVMTPLRRHAVEHPVEPGRLRLEFADYEQAQLWLDAERANLMAALSFAAANDLYEFTFGFPRALWELFNHRCHWDDWITACTLGLEAARDHGDEMAEAWMLIDLGSAYIRATRREEAVAPLEAAIEIRRRQGDVRGEATARYNLGAALFYLGRDADAEPMLQGALDLHRRDGNRFGEGAALSGLAEILARRGDADGAIRLHHEGRAVYREIGDQFNEGLSLMNLGQLMRRSGRLDEAVLHLRDGAARNRALGRIDIEANCWEELGRIHVELDDPVAAKAAYCEALALYEGRDLDAFRRVEERLAELS